MGNGNGVSRGDRNRNARLVQLRSLVPLSNAIVGIDLADNKQKPDHTLPGPTPFSYAGTDDGRGTDQPLDQNDSR